MVFVFSCHISLVEWRTTKETFSPNLLRYLEPRRRTSKEAEPAGEHGEVQDRVALEERRHRALHGPNRPEDFAASDISVDVLDEI